MFSTKKKDEPVSKFEVTSSTTHNIGIEGEFYRVHGNDSGVVLRKVPGGRLSLEPAPEFSITTLAELDELERLCQAVRQHFKQYQDERMFRCSRCGFTIYGKAACGCCR